MEACKVKIKKLSEKAVLPSYGSEEAAGADLCALLDAPIEIAPHTTFFVHTGIALSIPAGLVGLVYARSGLSCKQDLAPANKVGVVDSDYRGEIIVALHNHGEVTRTVSSGDRIAQIVFTPYFRADFSECLTLDETQRGQNGFGSTGK